MPSAQDDPVGYWGLIIGVVICGVIALAILAYILGFVFGSKSGDTKQPVPKSSDISNLNPLVDSYIDATATPLASDEGDMEVNATYPGEELLLTSANDYYSIVEETVLLMPDRSYISFSSNHKLVFQDDNLVGLIILDDRGLQYLTNPDRGTDYEPEWSPDNENIAFYSTRDGYRELYTIKADGSGQRRLTYDIGVDDGNFAWSPNSKQIAFTTSSGSKRDIFLIDTESNGLVNLTADVDSGDWREFFWSPTGDYLLVFVPHDSIYDTYLIAVKTADIIPLEIPTTYYDAESVWSPDGTKVIFEGFFYKKTCLIYVMSLGKDCSLRIEYQPAWSPDSKQIAFVSTRDGNPEIYVADLSDNNTYRLTYDTARDYYPTWAADGNRVFFISDRASPPSLYIMKLGESSSTRLTWQIDVTWYSRWNAPRIVSTAQQRITALRQQCELSRLSYGSLVGPKSLEDLSDDFDSAELADSWIVQQPDPAKWELQSSRGLLHIVGSYDNTSYVPNIFGQRVSCSDMDVIAKVRSEEYGEYSEIWMAITPNDYNETRAHTVELGINRNYSPWGVYMWECNSEACEQGATNLGGVTTDAHGDDYVYLKLSRQGNTYEGYYSLDGESWSFVGRANYFAIITDQVTFAATGRGGAYFDYIEYYTPEYSP